MPAKRDVCEAGDREDDQPRPEGFADPNDMLAIRRAAQQEDDGRCHHTRKGCSDKQSTGIVTNPWAVEPDRRGNHANRQGDQGRKGEFASPSCGRHQKKVRNYIGGNKKD